VVLNGQNDRLVVVNERRVINDLEDVLERDLGGETDTDTVVDDWLTVITVPDIEFNAPTTT